jgi:predicted Rossmann fold flavoprotein
METDWDIAVIGAGAAGLAAGIFAGEAAQAAGQSRKIALLDSAGKIGAKILVSGGGRCNVTHDEIQLDDFNGSRNIIRNILATFDEQATVRWFESLGVSLKREETGKLFPVSDSARTVLDALLRRCAELDISVLTQHRVQNIALLPDNVGARRAVPLQENSQQRDNFLIAHERGVLRARRIIMATGGKSLPRTGSDGSGWKIVQRLGHSITPTYPALVPLVLPQEMFHAELSGISLPVELSTFADGKLIDRRRGSLLWTHFGVSGPVVLDASRHWLIAQAGKKSVELRCSFLPGRRFEQVEQLLIDTAAARPRLSLGNALSQYLPDRLAGALIQWAKIDPALPLSQVSREQRRKLVHALTKFLLPVERDRGWNFAEVTAGGVPLSELHLSTMESRVCPGLFLCGEICDVDGRIGGFNFQWAWASGYVTGVSVGNKMSQT